MSAPDPADRAIAKAGCSIYPTWEQGEAARKRLTRLDDPTIINLDRRTWPEQVLIDYAIWESAPAGQASPKARRCRGRASGPSPRPSVRAFVFDSCQDGWIALS
jgi:hypothetical protein